MPAQPLKRRWFQFRLRTLLLLFIVASVLSSFAARIERNRQQRLAACELWHLGGMVGDGHGTFYSPGCDDYWMLDDLDLIGRPRKVIHFDGVCASKDLAGYDVSKLEAIIRKFPSVEVVEFVNTYDTLEWIERLRDALPQCDIGFETPTTFSPGFNVDDSDLRLLRHFRKPTRIETVRLDGSDVTDVGLQQLNDLPNLTTLVLNSTLVTDAGLVYVNRLSKLEVLCLCDTRVTDHGLEHLTHMDGLRVLSVDGNRISDSGLKCLEGMGNLDFVSLNRTNVTLEGVKKLQEALPNSKIEYDEPTAAMQ